MLPNLSGQVPWRCVLAACLVLTSSGLLGSPAAAEEGQFMSREEVGAAIADVLEALARRKLTPEEIKATTEEYIPLFGDTECTAKCVEVIEYNARSITPAREQSGGPEEALVRHDFIAAIYFSPEQNGSLIQRISAEADPVMVVEPSPPQLMTRADVVASMNLYIFSQESGPPQARRFDEADIAAAADEMNRLYQSPAHIMSRHLPLAATYWAGLERGWSGFTEEERTLVRAYFANDRPQDALPSNLYTTLLGLAPGRALDFSMQIFQDSMRDIAVQGAILRTQMAIWRSYTFGRGY